MAERRPDPTNPPSSRKTYTRAQFVDFYGAQYGGQMWRKAGQGAGGGVERRRDPTTPKSKKTYTRQQFVEFYGGKHGAQMWRQAGGAQQPAQKKKQKPLRKVKRLNQGKLNMPALGLGTFKADKGEVGAAVTAAVKAGYRLIDCAGAYGNEAEVGEALAELFKAGVVKRSELFIVSKLFQTHHVWDGDPSRCKEAIDKTLKDLQLEYVDLYLIHWPFAFQQKVLDFPLRLDDGTPNPKLTVQMEYHDTWKLESFKEEGKVKAIGVSNFTAEQIEDLCSKSKTKPAVNQVEVHPYNSQVKLRRYCRKNRIHVMAYAPFGGAAAATKYPEKHGCSLLNSPVIKEIAERVGKSAGQVLVRWSLQRGCISIPKSQKSERIAENGAVWDFSLPEKEVKKIDELNADFRYFVSYLKKPDNDVLWHDGVVGHKEIK